MKTAGSYGSKKPRSTPDNPTPDSLTPDNQGIFSRSSVRRSSVRRNTVRRNTEGVRQRPLAGKSGQISRDWLGGRQIEGKRAVIELLSSHRRKVEKLYIAAESLHDPEMQRVVSLADSVKLQPVLLSSTDLAALARTSAPQGVVAVAEPVVPVPLHDLCASATDDASNKPGLIVVLDGITDPGNLGSLIRSTECAGGTGIVLPRRRGVHLVPAAVKAAAGAVEYLPISVVPGIPSCLTELHKQGVWSICLVPGGKEDLTELSILREPLAIVLGSEGHGVARLTMARCDAIASIPQAGKISSLNVAVAGAAALYLIRYIRAASQT